MHICNNANKFIFIIIINTKHILLCAHFTYILKNFIIDDVY